MDELYHHGILGQRWGVRRYQNKDGTLTSEGKRHRDESDNQPSRSDKIKRGAKIAAGVLGTAALVYLAHKTGADKKAIEAGKKLASSYLTKRSPELKKAATPIKAATPKKVSPSLDTSPEAVAARDAAREAAKKKMHEDTRKLIDELNRMTPMDHSMPAHVVAGEAERRKAAREAHLKEINAAMNSQMKDINKAGKAGRDLNDMAERFINMNATMVIR